MLADCWDRIRLGGSQVVAFRVGRWLVAKRSDGMEGWMKIGRRLGRGRNQDL